MSVSDAIGNHSHESCPGQTEFLSILATTPCFLSVGVCRVEHMFDVEHDMDLALLEEDPEVLFRLTVAAYGEDTPDEQHFLPRDLEEIAPGPYLAAVVSGVDRSKLSGHDVVRLMNARARLVSHYQAGLYADIAEVAHAYDPDTAVRDSHPVEFAAEEIQTALTKTRTSARLDLELALHLRLRLPRVWEAMAAGDIDLARAKVFARELESLHPALVPEAVNRLISQAPELTTGQLRARLQRVALELEPEAADDRFEAGVEDRKMTVQSNPDLTASLLFHNADPKEVLLASRYVHGVALKLKRRPGETRTLDQLKVDIALDLLQGKTIEGAPPAPTPIMVILDELAGHVPGYGTILPGTVRGLLEDAAGVEVTTTDDDCGDDDCGREPTSRRPTKAQKRHARNRYPTCVFPGCRMPATECDLDHRHPWIDGGPTACHNLAPLCRHHHTCKPKWKLVRETDGSHVWTSRLGHTYRTEKPP